MFFRRVNVAKQVHANGIQAERLKKSTIKDINRNKEKTEKLNALMDANGFNLFIHLSQHGGRHD